MKHDVWEADQPTCVTYARRLATYIANASTIRAYTLAEWGRAPSLQRCAKYRQEFELAEVRAAELAYRRLYPKTSPFACGHPKDEQTIFEIDGREVCGLCRRPPKPTSRRQGQIKNVEVREPNVIPIGGLASDQLVSYVAAQFGLTKQEILGHGRKLEQVYARTIVSLIMREDRNATHRQIGTLLNRDHKAPYHLIRMWPGYVRLRPKLATALEKARKAASGAP